MSVFSQQPVNYPPPGGDKVSNARLFDIFNLPLLLGVLVCFFMPLCTITCGPAGEQKMRGGPSSSGDFNMDGSMKMTIKFTGMNLATGSDPTFEGMDMKEFQQKSGKKDNPTDALLLAMPVLALVGLVLSVLALMSRAQPGSSGPGIGAGVGLVGVLLVAVLGYYAAVGFKVENDARKDAKSPANSEVVIEAKKTMAFWFALGAAALVVPLAFLRGSSPRLGGSRPPRQVPPLYSNPPIPSAPPPPMPPNYGGRA